MDTAQLAYPQAGFSNLLPYSSAVLVIDIPDLGHGEYSAAADPEHVCAACGHEMEQFKAGRLDCVFCGVHIDLGE